MSRLSDIAQAQELVNKLLLINDKHVAAVQESAILLIEFVTLLNKSIDEIANMKEVDNG